MRRTALIGAAILLVASVSPLLAAGADRTWNAAISGAGISGRATLTLPAGERSATAILYLNKMRSGTAVSAQLRSGACGETGSLIARLPTFTTTSGGTWHDRGIYVGEGLRNLKKAVAAGATITIRATVGSRSACAAFEPAS